MRAPAVEQRMSEARRFLDKKIRSIRFRGGSVDVILNLASYWTEASEQFTDDDVVPVVIHAHRSTWETTFDAVEKAVGCGK